MTASIILPDQLFEKIDFSPNERLILLEEYSYFRAFRFHKQKLAFHRASMKSYEHFLNSKGFRTSYIESDDERSDIAVLIGHLAKDGYEKLRVCAPCSLSIIRKIDDAAKANNIDSEYIDSEKFILNTEEALLRIGNHKHYRQTDFYIGLREDRGILTDSYGAPVGGKWSFDTENRHKYPSSMTPPVWPEPGKNRFYDEAVEYVMGHFADNPGEINLRRYYPIDHDEAKDWFDLFLATRFSEFGIYEDAIRSDSNIINHSVISPLLNTGLLLPDYAVTKAIDHGIENKLPINSIEGFVRQITGWREYIRAIYLKEGELQMKSNFWNFTRLMPDCFYSASTGIRPVDDCLIKLNATAYNHHIERLMVISNFMLLCEISPNEVYRWFMEMYIDSYEWVMVPNIYGMAQFADAGTISSKPYISGSNYIINMSNYKKNETWCEIWDSLFWRFIDKHSDYFSTNPRLSLLLNEWNKQSRQKKDEVISLAQEFLSKL